LSAMLLALPAIAAETKIGPKGQVLVNGKPVIPLGVWMQPAFMFPYFRTLGMNCIVVPDNNDGLGVGPQTNLDAAVANKLGLIVPPDKGPMPADHPAIWGRLGGVMSPRDDGDRFAGAYARARKADPNHFQMLNIDIHQFLGGQDADYYGEALKNTDAVISHVWPQCLDPNKPDLRNVGTFVDLVRKYTKDRRGGAVCIMPDINPHAWHLNQRGLDIRYPSPTQEELRFQIWLALIHGANGLCFFPISFDPFVYSQIPARNELEMLLNSKLIEKMTSALTADESNLKIEVISDRKDGILDWTTRTAGGRHYVFLLNGQREAQNVTFRAPELGKKWQLHDAVMDSLVPSAGGEYKENLPGLALRIWELREPESRAASRPSGD
jgi:hypothetical protein